MEIRLDGKRALVTGGSSGIGAAIVKALAASGAHVAIGASRRVEQARQMAETIRAGGGTATAIAADLAHAENCQRLVDEAVSALGGLDILIHSAGIDVTQTASLHETPDETWDQMLAIHLTAAFHISKRAIPALLKNPASSVLFVGSVAGIVAWEGDVAYNVAKAGLHHLARCIAADYSKQGLRANAIAPGVIDTPLTRGYASGMPGGEAEGMKVLAGLHPVGRYAAVEEVASAAVYLVSDQASFITGTVLPIDGGLTMI